MIIRVRGELPTGTVTFLFTDVEGSTKLLEEIGDEAYEEALAEHRRAVREACAEHGGVEVDTQGDAFFLAFPTAPGALAAASEMTSELASGLIRVRIGLHSGEPRLGEEGYVGKEVHFAARVAATGHGGQIVLSKATAELIDGPLTDLGEHRLKDIPEPVPIYQLGEERFPPLKTISNTNLPRPASSFVGREAELEEVLAKIERGARLLTLTGPGGSGKTRLALEAASTLVPAYKAGVFWVGLASLRDPGLVTETISQTLGAKDGLAEHVGERELLLLLDNLEQVIEAAAELAALVSACPNLTLIVTSRELLRVSGEVEYPVPPLAEAEAVSLFCARSQLEPTEGVAELCARLDNLPLAVELAAARTKALSPAQILERLSQRLDLLTGGRDADPRQQTLRATIAWSYDLLADEEQRLFRALSVFAGGCTLEAAEEVCIADLDTLQSLVEKSLLRFSNERYWMLETIREYAGESLRGLDESEGLSSRHADYFRAFADRVEDHLREPEWIEIVENEVQNIRAMVAWARDHDPALVAHVTSALAFFWGPHGHATEVLGWLDSVRSAELPSEVRLGALRMEAAIANTTFDASRIRTASEQRLDLARRVGDVRHEAAALHMLGCTSQYEGDFVRARQYLGEALELWRQVDNAPQMRGTLGALGVLAQEREDLPLASTLLDEFLSLAEGDYEVAWGLIILGGIHADSGRYVEATTHLRQGCDMTAALHNGELLHMAVLTVAFLTMSRGEPRKAAVLAGAVSALSEQLEMKTLSLHRMSTMLERIPESLDDSEFDSLFAQGHSLQSGDALDYALHCLD
jgi:predicted ATPase/class 3 adenylate cyclase